MFRKAYKAINIDHLRLSVNNDNNNNIFFGGEPAAEKITNYLKPLEYTIYSNEELTNLGKELKLIPDNNGNVKIYNTCWLESLSKINNNLAPSLVVYADLMGTNNSRNIEAAKMILENEL